MTDQTLNDDLPRYTDRNFPSYSYVPGQFPHPIRSPDGHSHGLIEHDLDVSDNAALREEFLWAVDLFNHGYYWEAHESWEGLWHAFDRTGHDADYLKALIKLAAAGVKLLEGRSVGVARHARRAAELMLSTKAAEIHPALQIENPLELIASLAMDCATNADSLPGPRLQIMIHCARIDRAK